MYSIEYPRYYIDYIIREPPNSYVSKAAARVFDEIDNGKYGVLLLTNVVDLIDKNWYGFHNEEMVGQLRKVDPNESGGLDRFVIVRWFVDKEVSLGYAEEAESLVGWGCKVSLMDIH